MSGGALVLLLARFLPARIWVSLTHPLITHPPLPDRSLAPMYYRGAGAAVVVFDLTSRESFEGARSWVRELQRRGDPNVVIALAGNKVG